MPLVTNTLAALLGSFKSALIPAQSLTTKMCATRRPLAAAKTANAAALSAVNANPPIEKAAPSRGAPCMRSISRYRMQERHRRARAHVEGERGAARLAKHGVSR